MTRRVVGAALASLALLAGSPSWSAESLLQDDFQDGDAAGWGAAGRGDVRLSTYSGNVSLRISGEASALRTTATGGVAALEVSGAIAAADLDDADACLIEASIDGGRSWVEVLRVANGADDGVTLRRGAAALAGASAVVVRLRAAVHRRAATCWFDDVSLRGQRPVTGTAGRLQLGVEQLRGKVPMPGPVPLAAFAPAAGAAPAVTGFSGRLTFEVVPAEAGFELLRDSLRLGGDQDRSYRWPPRFDFQFVQVDDRLVPIRRGSVPGEHTWWEWLVEPGRVWSEPGDGGLSRAAIPFALEEKNANCMHNGVLTFVFGPRGEISRVAYQVSQETCAYFKFNAWGLAAGRYEPGDVPGAAQVAAAYRREVAGRFPLRPLAALARDFPGVDPAAFGSAAEVTPEHMTAFGVVVNGVHYAGGCETRHGPYPFCDELLLPSYSLAKSVAAGLGLMRLERLHPEAKQALLVDYVPRCRETGGWDGVTFDNLLDMATGRYDSLEREVDENASVASRFFISESHAEKMQIACTRYPRRSRPGERWVYHTTDTYLLGTAMQAFWRKRYGDGADFFRDVLVGGIWTPLGLGPAAAVTRRTYDAAAQPFMGWGLTLTRDDVAKLGVFFAAGEGRVDGVSLVAPAEMAAALQRNPSDRGLHAASGDFRYNNGVWAWESSRNLGCRQATWLPFMSGFGGISVVLLPNGAVYYYFSDNGDYRWARAAAEADKFGAYCKR